MIKTHTHTFIYTYAHIHMNLSMNKEKYYLKHLLGKYVFAHGNETFSWHYSVNNRV